MIRRFPILGGGAVLSLIIALGGSLVGGTLIAGAAELPPLRWTLEPVKDVFTQREGLPVRVVFEAQKPLRLCLEKNVLSQLRLTVSRQGTRRITPVVITDTRPLFQDPRQILRLQPGQRHVVTVNLKQLAFEDQVGWQPGEYSVKGIFSLCDPRESDNEGVVDVEVPAANVARFLLLSR